MRVQTQCPDPMRPDPTPPEAAPGRRTGRGVPLWQTINELASTFGIHRTTVTAHLHDQGVTLRGAGQLDAAETARLYGEGWSSRELGETFGVSANTVLSLVTSLRTEQVRGLGTASPVLGEQIPE